ncbi:HIT family protein [Aquitalea aquatica]|uniref:HIT family protein n=1 Tax=Aquitalea aquatica TaxID=3044273 RepID=A0A838YFS5_9NEIS|nr:HIT family protein [Aquitalea magnusonii]MBA4709915.1 HIT family protein [Aquitalea magnusonii]
MTCPLCTLPAGELLHEDSLLWVLLVNEAGYPGFCRVIWKQHVREMSDLSAADTRHLLDWVLHTERALRQVMQPEKINLASLGNVVPHLHWHVIPRFADDAHFPSPIWASPQREGADHNQAGLADSLRAALKNQPLAAAVQ